MSPENLTQKANDIMGANSGVFNTLKGIIVAGVVVVGIMTAMSSPASAMGHPVHNSAAANITAMKVLDKVGMGRLYSVEAVTQLAGEIQQQENDNNLQDANLASYIDDAYKVVSNDGRVDVTPQQIIDQAMSEASNPGQSVAPVVDRGTQGGFSARIERFRNENPSNTCHINTKNIEDSQPECGSPIPK